MTTPDTVLATPSRDTPTTRVGRRVYRKHALPFTTFAYRDGRTVSITPEFARRMKENFDAGVRDIVPVPARGAGGHSDDWRDSKGRTVGLEVDPDKGIFVTIEVDEEADRAIAANKLGGVSLSFDEDWFDPRQGQRIGPVLRHTALTNVNYIHGTEPFAPVSLSEGDTFFALVPVKPGGDPEADAAEIDRLVALSEPATDTLASPADRSEIDRLRQVAAALLTGTSFTEPTPADHTDDGSEITRLATLAKENR
jgi:hypothetical protein